MNIYRVLCTVRELRERQILQSVTHRWNLKTLNRNRAEKVMAPHSSTLAWKIPWMEEPGELQSMGSLRVGHD